MVLRKRERACTKFGDVVLDSDAFGEGFSFTLPNGKAKYNTWCGVFFTFSLYFVIAVYGLMKLGKVVNFGDSTIIKSTEDSFFDADFKWNATSGMSFAFGITAYDGNQEPIDDPDYGRVVARYKTWGFDDYTSYSEPIPTKQCTKD